MSNSCRTEITARLIGFCLGVTLHCSGAVAECRPVEAAPAVILSPALTVASLNVAHGRNDSLNQMFLSNATIHRNLRDVAAQLRGTGADVVALQEADAASGWSGKFNHVEFLAIAAGFPCSFHGLHDKSSFSRYGTALLSKHPIVDARSHNFAKSWPTKPKGFVVGKIAWNPDQRLAAARQVSLVSVHLDFSRTSVRTKQIEEMASTLGAIEGPKIVMGDFNSDWSSKNSAVQLLANKLSLKAFQPMSQELATYGSDGERLDWILISQDLQFKRYEVVEEAVSDHLMVVTSVTLREFP